MSELLHELVQATSRRHPGHVALAYQGRELSYGALAEDMVAAARGLVGLGVGRGERVAIFLEKRIETVLGMVGAAAAGAVFVPINPLLRARQVHHILKDCGVRVLVTSAERLAALADGLEACHDLRAVVLVDGAASAHAHLDIARWDAVIDEGRRSSLATHRVIDQDMAAILYTSGSTGLPKGVVLSHRNIVAGAKSVSLYLENTPEDRILSVLPLSFDAGMSQLTTAFNVGAGVVLMNYLLPNDVIRHLARHAITGLACVPPLWNQLCRLAWPEAAAASLRYITNTGGHMPLATLKALRAALPRTKVYLMYGLTEAFRSTYLPPDLVDERPDSIGKAIPNAEILVVRENGELCAPNEPGELVHRGALVAMGYWNDPERTAERFRPSPLQPEGLSQPEIAVWSGDTVRRDEDGFLYFIGRRDEMIKTSGYRVSPTEVEEVVYTTGQAAEAVALGAPHPMLGQGIVVLAVAHHAGRVDTGAVIEACKAQLPPFMVPLRVIEVASLPRNPNGKIDRTTLAAEYAEALLEAAS
jgi:acyl-CoA ligase (AMP-forming) (exosortase A-associated)